MTKQEEIREGIDDILWGRDPDTDRILNYLHTQGVVIRVKCPKCQGHARPNKVTYNLHTGYTINGHSCPNCNNTGYVAVEGLI